MKKKHLLIKREGCVVGCLVVWTLLFLANQLWLARTNAMSTEWSRWPLVLPCLATKPDLCIFHIPLVLVQLPCLATKPDCILRPLPSLSPSQHPPQAPSLNVVDYLVLWISVCAVCKRFDQIIWIGLFLVSLFANGPDLPWWCLREKYKSGKS